MKKIVSVVLCICLLIGAMPFGLFSINANAASSGTTGDCTWRLSGTTLTISGNGAMGDYTYQNNAPWGQEVAKVIINSGVTNIGDYAFCFCDSLTSVTIPDSVTSIGDNAFSHCSSLTTITIPDSVTSIDSGAFSPSGLTNIHVADNNRYYSDINGVLFNKTQTEIISYPRGKTEKSYTIPDSVTSIGNYALAYCDSLTSIIIPDSVTNIGGSAFYCDRFTSITIPNSVTSIGAWAFAVTYLTSISIPDSVTSIGNHAFYECGSLTSITIPDSVTSLGNYAFWACYELKSANIGNGVTSIGNSAFQHCYNLTSISIGNSVESIGERAFFACSNLTSITIPASVTSIGDNAFVACDSLTNITIPANVTSIGKYAFFDCNNLTNINIPASVTNIGYYAFHDCDNLTITVNKNNSVYCNDEYGVLFNKSKTELIRVPGRLCEDYVIPASVTSIGDGAFSGCTNCTYIIIPDSVTYIGEAAFSECSSLINIIIPDSVTYIGENALSGCSSLTSITLPFVGSSPTENGTLSYIFGRHSPENLESVILSDACKKIGDSAFNGYDSLTSVIIGSCVISIGEYAFYSCDNLDSINIPISVKSIDKYAFYNCSSLTDVYYTGNQSDWNKINIGDKNDSLNYAIIHYDVENSNNIDITTDTYYKNLADNYPQYLNNSSYNQFLSFYNQYCYEVIEDYSENETWLLSFLETFVNLTDIILQDAASEIGIGQNLEEEWLEKNALTFAHALTGAEPLLEEAWNSVKKSYKDFKFIYDAAEDVSKATLVNEIAKSSPCLTYNTVKGIVDTIYERADELEISKVFTEASRVVDFVDVTLFMCQLYQVETEVLEQLLALIPSDTPLYEGLKDILDNIEKDPVDYVLTKYLSKVFVSEAVGFLEKAGKWATGKLINADINLTYSLVTLTSKLLYDYVYQVVKIDELYGAIVSYDFFTTINNSLTDTLIQFMSCKTNSTTPETEMLTNYKILFNARIVAFEQYIDSCMTIAKDDSTKSLLEQAKEFINSSDAPLGFDNYIVLCRAKLDNDIKNGTLSCEHGIYNFESTVPSTCTEQGYTIKQCALCDSKIKEDYKDALGHEFISYTYNNNATCDRNGTETGYCNRGCGVSNTRVVENSAIGHSFTNYISDCNATLGNNGTKTARCDHGCGASHTVVDEGSEFVFSIIKNNKNYIGKPYDEFCDYYVDSQDTTDCFWRYDHIYVTDDNVMDICDLVYMDYEYKNGRATVDIDNDGSTTLNDLAILRKALIGEKDYSSKP